MDRIYADMDRKKSSSSTSSSQQKQQKQQQQQQQSSSRRNNTNDGNNTSSSSTNNHRNHPNSSSSSSSTNVPLPPPPSSSTTTRATTMKSSKSSSSSSKRHLSSSSSSSQSQSQQQMISVESPLPPVVQRCLGDRSYEKRKTAALEVEALIKSLAETQNWAMISAVIAVLAKEFCTSMNSNYRKGGLIGIAATAIGLMPAHTPRYLEELIPPVLHCFDDPESRVRYYACESLYNIAKVARTAILRFFNQMFDGLTKLFADVDADVKNGANLLDRLIKDIVTESTDFSVEEFLPLLQNYIRRTNPYIRQLLVGWITVLDSVPDISMIDYLPDFLDGLFNMLSDSNREIRQAADSALSEFLREVRLSTVVEFGPIISILVLQCHSPERLNRLTATTWLAELIHHPYSGGDAVLPYHSEVLGAVMTCLSDVELEIRKVSETTNRDLLSLVQTTTHDFELPSLLTTLTTELMGKDDVPTKMAALRWINMLLEKRRGDMNAFIPELLPVLLRTLSDASDAVVLLNLQVLSRISLPPRDKKPIASSSTSSSSSDVVKTRPSSKSAKFAEIKRAEMRKREQQKEDDSQLQMVLNAILGVFATDRQLLETRGSLIVRKLCVLLNAKSVYMRMADALASYDPPNSNKSNNNNNHDTEATTSSSSENSHAFTLEFIATMVQTLNLILLTAAELHSLRTILSESFVVPTSSSGVNSSKAIKSSSYVRESEGAKVFCAIFTCWCHNPVATFSLCLLAQAYDLAFGLVKKFSELEVTVGFLMQIDKLVQLLESPIFVHVRLQLLDVEAPYHTHLLKSCYGLLMLLPQSDAFRSLNDRLATVCNLRDNLGIAPSIVASPGTVTSTHNNPNKKNSPSADTLLSRFDDVVQVHRQAREVETQVMLQESISNNMVIHTNTNNNSNTTNNNNINTTNTNNTNINMNNRYNTNRDDAYTSTTNPRNASTYGGGNAIPSTT